MMAAVLPSSTPIAASKPNERHTILTELLDAVKQCQIRFGGRAELATESDLRVAVLCNRLETALSHGLRFKPLSKNSSTIRQVTEIVSSSLHLSRGHTQDHLVFWHYVREHLTRHELERYLVLKQVWTDTGRGRAWLRSALNERSLERYLHSLLGSTEHVAVFYEDWAFVADQERSSMLTTMAAGLGSILFAISIDNLDLNQPRTRRESPEPIVSSLAGNEAAATASSTDAGGRRRRRRVPANIISFDDDDAEDGTGVVQTSSSAPATRLGSPATENATVSRTEPGPNGPRANENAWKRPTDLDLSQPSVPGAVPGAVPTAVSAESPASSRGGSPDFARKHREPRDRVTAQTLTPVNSAGVGALIPVPRGAEEAPSEEDSASAPSLSGDSASAPSLSGDTAECLRNGEVRQAVLSLLSHKDDLQAQTHALRRMLDDANEANAELRAEVNETQRSSKERAERLETRIQALTRENELLKHQLRKYVAAVQMLKRDGTQAHEALATLEAAQAQAPPPDYHHEAQEYEKKLIQVAEMHGELMEFNERLHRLVLRKDASLCRLREELVELRGPLPDDVATDDDEASVVSEPAANAAAQRTLINIWIPSAFLTGGSSDVHHVYQVFIRIRDDEWNIYRRYSQFHSLHKELKKKDSAVATFDFPPKKTLGNKDACFVEERRRRLQHYLRCVVNQLGQSNAELASSPDKDLLISLVPFFGEISTAVEDKGRRKRASSRNPFSRLGRNHDAGQPSAHSPQYTGL